MSNHDDSTRIHLLLPVELRDAIEKVAAKEDRSASSTIRSLCREGIERRTTTSQTR
jgi:hypothetical protein